MGTAPFKSLFHQDLLLVLTEKEVYTSFVYLLIEVRSEALMVAVKITE
jgi:hypothetical protein